MGAAPSKMSAMRAAPFQTPDDSPYRMPDSAPMGTNPQNQMMRSMLAAQLSRSRMPDDLNDMGNPGMSFAKERIGQMAERQDVGDELGGMGSLGGVGQALALRGEQRRAAPSRPEFSFGGDSEIGGMGAPSRPSRRPNRERIAAKRSEIRQKMARKRAERSRRSARGRV